MFCNKVLKDENMWAAFQNVFVMYSYCVGVCGPREPLSFISQLGKWSAGKVLNN